MRPASRTICTSINVSVVCHGMRRDAERTYDLVAVHDGLQTVGDGEQGDVFLQLAAQ